MNNKLIIALGAVCMALLLIIIGEWFIANYAEQQLLTITIPKGAKTAQDEMPSITLDEQSPEAYADLVSRPLFMEGRKPVNEPTAAEIQNGQVAVKFDWVLNGVYTYKNKLSALLTRAVPTLPKRDNFRKITVGTLLDGWKLAEINKDKVVFVQDDTPKELTLRKAKPKQLQPKPGNPALAQQPPQQPDAAAPVPVPIPDAEQPELEPEPVDESLENSDNEQF